MRAADSFAAPVYPLQYVSAGRLTDVVLKSFRHVYPDRQVFTLLLKNVWICASVIDDLFVKTASLMMLPALKPTSVVLTMPLDAGSDATLAMGVPAPAIVAVAALAGIAVPIVTAMAARKTVRIRVILGTFRGRGARRDM